MLLTKIDRRNYKIGLRILALLFILLLTVIIISIFLPSKSSNTLLKIKKPHYTDYQN